jgi:hypothetical protein
MLRPIGSQADVHNFPFRESTTRCCTASSFLAACRSWGQVRLCQLRPATVRLASHCGHHPALQRTAVTGRFC